MREYTFAQKLNTTLTVMLTLAFAATPRLYAQHTDGAAKDLRMPNQTAYVEILGPGGFASINYDRKLNRHITARVGYGRWWTFRSIPAGDQDNDNVRLVPVSLNYLLQLRPGSAHWLEVGGGAVMGDRWSGGDYEPHHDLRAALATVAYRGMDGRSVLRLSVSFVRPLMGNYPLPGFRPGVSFGSVF
jgi:hypothetical protein